LYSFVGDAYTFEDLIKARIGYLQALDTQAITPKFFD